MSLGCVHKVENEFERWAFNRADSIEETNNATENADEPKEFVHEIRKGSVDRICPVSAWNSGIFSKNEGKTTEVLPQRFIFRFRRKFKQTHKELCLRSVRKLREKKWSSFRSERFHANGLAGFFAVVIFPDSFVESCHWPAECTDPVSFCPQCPCWPRSCCPGCPPGWCSPLLAPDFLGGVRFSSGLQNFWNCIGAGISK